MGVRGRPRTSPVYFAPDGYHLLYWISSPDAVHSRNVVERPDVSLVVFDSTVLVGTAEAVYMTARAEQVPDDELDACARSRPAPRPWCRPPARRPSLNRVL